MACMFVEFDGITKDLSETPGQTGYHKKESKTSHAQHTSKSLMAAASDLGGYYAQRHCPCSWRRTFQVIYGLRPRQQRPTFTTDRLESKIAGKRLERLY